MLISALGVLAALAFVLGLGALCLWGLKRWGRVSMSARTRVAVEVVQRVSLGPKTGLAVIRVGEKVMAVSVGDGGIRPLFELDEADRQRVIGSSQIAMPMQLSQEASDLFAKAEPRALPSIFTAPFAKRAPVSIKPERAASMTTERGLPVSYGPPVASANASVTSASEGDFRAMLGGALSSATRLAVFAGAMILASGVITSARAQAAPPITPPVAPPTTQATQAATQGTAQQASPPATQQLASPVPASAATPARTAAPQVPTVPDLSAGNTAASSLQNGAANATANVTANPSATQAAGAQQSAPTVTQQGLQPTAPVPPKAPIVQSARAPRGNGASTTAGTAARGKMSDMQLDSAMTAAKGRAVPGQPATADAGEALMRAMPQMDIKLGDAKDGGLRLNGTVGIVVMMGLLTLLPTLLLMMTGFTRILIVLHFLKQAMGTQSAPPAQLLAAMALLLTGFVMAPTLSEVNRTAVTPWLDGKITQVEMMKTGVVPMREFMLKQTRESDLKTFIEMSRLPRPNTADDVPLHVLMSAFVASELRKAFQIGFAIYLPFIIIDTVVASVLMSMGMFMLPPAMISLPFKLLLFVLVDGWSLTITSLVQSFK